MMREFDPHSAYKVPLVEGLFYFTHFSIMKDIRYCQITNVESILKNPKKEFHETDNPVKAYKLTINTGTEERTVVSAIADLFKPEELLNTITTFQCDLDPREIRGFTSQAMIYLDDKEEEKLIIGETIGAAYIELEWTPPTLDDCAAYLEKHYGFLSDAHSAIIMRMVEFYKESKDKVCKC